MNDTLGTYVEGAHFQFDGLIAHLEIILHPDGEESVAITSQSVCGIASGLDIRGSAMFCSTNEYEPKQFGEF